MTPSASTATASTALPSEPAEPAAAVTVAAAKPIAAPPPSKAVTFARGVFLWLLRLAWVPAGIALGVLLLKSHPAEASRFGFGSPGGFRMITHPDPKFERIGLELVVSQLQGAKSSIVMLAGQLSSKRILDTLIARQNEGITVTLIIPALPEKSRSLSQALVNAGFKGLYQYPYNFDEQIVLIDDKVALFGLVPWSVAQANNMSGSVLLTGNREAVDQVRAYLESRQFAATRIR